MTRGFGCEPESSRRPISERFEQPWAEKNAYDQARGVTIAKRIICRQSYTLMLNDERLAEWRRAGIVTPSRVWQQSHSHQRIERHFVASCEVVLEHCNPTIDRRSV